ncbi:MAG: hypothetical protein ACXW33_09640, partial [Sulfuricurvum sp.]
MRIAPISKTTKGQTMKKIITSTIIATVLSTAAFADQGSLTGTQIGYSSNTSDTYASSSHTSGGIYIGTDLIAMIASLPGFGAGIGMDFNVWQGPGSAGIADDTASIYTLGATAKVGYTFENSYNLPLRLKAGVGYGAFSVPAATEWGMQYDASAE